MALKKIKASSLIETIVAMLVLVLVFLFSVIIINNVMQSAYLGAKSKAILKMHELLAITKRDKIYLNDSFSSGNYTILKNIELKSGNESLLLIEFVLEDEKHAVISTIKEEVLVD